MVQGVGTNKTLRYLCTTPYACDYWFLSDRRSFMGRVLRGYARSSRIWRARRDSQKLLLLEKADPDTYYHLQAAASAGSAETVELLLDAGICTKAHRANSAPRFMSLLKQSHPNVIQMPIGRGHGINTGVHSPRQQGTPMPVLLQCCNILALLQIPLAELTLVLCLLHVNMQTLIL